MDEGQPKDSSSTILKMLTGNDEGTAQLDTGRTLQFLNKFSHKVPRFNRKTLHYELNAKRYQLITHNTSDFNKNEYGYASINSRGTGREIMLLDPNSTLLNETYGNLIKFITESNANKNNSQKTKRILKATINFCKNTLNKDNKKELKEIVRTNFDFSEDRLFYKTKRSARRRKQIYSISLDKFVNEGIGRCRHHALLACYLISRLIDDGILPPGKVFHHRDMIKRGLEHIKESSPKKYLKGTPHIWVMYQTDKGTLYFFDSYWGNLKRLVKRNKIEEKSVQYIHDNYGLGVVPEIAKRYDERIECDELQNPNP